MRDRRRRMHTAIGWKVRDQVRGDLVDYGIEFTEDNRLLESCFTIHSVDFDQENRILTFFDAVREDLAKRHGYNNVVR